MSAPEYTTLKLELDQHIATVQLNRPDKANAMNERMFTELAECMGFLDRDDNTRVVILTGAGKHFCSGMDLSVFASLQGEKAELKETIVNLQSALTSIEQCKKPVLAAVNGACLGGGLDLICCCDARYGSEACFFSIKEVDLAMTADLGSLQRLPHSLSSGMLNEMAYTGRNVGAEEAMRVGLINAHYKSQEDLLAAVLLIAQTIAAKSPQAVQGTKTILQHARDHSVTEGLAHVADWNAEHLDFQAIAQAIKEKANKK